MLPKSVSMPDPPFFKKPFLEINVFYVWSTGFLGVAEYFCACGRPLFACTRRFLSIYGSWPISIPPMQVHSFLGKRLVCASSSGKEVRFGTPHAADNQKTPLWPTYSNYQGMFFSPKKTCFLAFFPHKLFCDLYRKNRLKNAKKHVFFRENRKTPLGG